MRCLVFGLVVSLLVAGCSTTPVPRADVPELVREAFRSADLEATDISVARSSEGDSWSATVTANGAELALSVDAEAGRIERIELDDSTAISKDQLRAIARYESNRADERARTRRRVVALVVLVALVTGGLLVARHFRLREERRLTGMDEEF